MFPQLKLDCFAKMQSYPQNSDVNIMSSTANNKGCTDKLHSITSTYNQVLSRNRTSQSKELTAT